MAKKKDYGAGGRRRGIRRKEENENDRIWREMEVRKWRRARERETTEEWEGEWD